MTPQRNCRIGKRYFIFYGEKHEVIIANQEWMLAQHDKYGKKKKASVVA